MRRKSKVLRFPSRKEEALANYKTGQSVPESGIYRVLHDSHRLPHEVTLLKSQVFPRCAKCAGEVHFQVVALAPVLPERRGRIILYQLPELARDEECA